MRLKDILVFGGSGFLGSHLIAQLVDRGARVTVATRRRDHARHLFLLPTVDVVECDLARDEDLARLVAGRDAVVNLVGILHGDRGTPYGRAFLAAHVELPRRIATAARTGSVRRLIHMSALGAAKDAPSMYLRSKADGEAAVQSADGIDWTIFRPSVIFGEDDRFLNLFGTLQKWFPVIPLGSSAARFQPVYVGDVARAMIAALNDPATVGKTFELAGPRIYSLAELVRLAGAAKGYARPIIALPDALARLQALAMEMMPGEPLISRDNIDSMRRDNIATSSLPGLDDPVFRGELPDGATSLESILPSYSPVHAQSAHLDRLRARAHR